MKRPRKPKVLTDEKLKEIFDGMAEGLYAAHACRKVGIHPNTFFYRVQNDEDAEKTYETLRKAQAERWAQELVQLADQATPENVKVAELQIKTRQWYIERALRKLYGENPEPSQNQMVLLQTNKYGSDAPLQLGMAQAT